MLWGDRILYRWGVVLCSFGDPAANQLDLLRLQRLLILRHRRRRPTDELHQNAVVRIAGLIRWPARTPGSERFKAGQDQLAALHNRLMAALAALLENRPDFTIVANRLAGLQLRRSGERRVGEEWRSRWAPD